MDEFLGFRPIGPVPVTGEPKPEAATSTEPEPSESGGFRPISSAAPNKTTTAGQIGTGMMDPVYGAAQLAGHAMQEPPAFPSDEPPNQAAGAIDKVVRDREAGIAQARGVDAEKIDWSRMLGNMLSPANYIGAAVGGPEVGIVSTIGRGVVGGTVAGALEPAPDFSGQKAGQIGLGAATGGVVGAAGKTVSGVVGKVGEYLARNHPEALENRAVQLILRRFGQDEKYGGPTAADSVKLINETNKPMALADVTGPNVSGLAGNVARAPGESKALAKRFVTERDEFANARLETDIADHIHSGPSAHRTMETLLHARSAAARPLYDDVRTLEQVWSPRLQEFLNHKDIKEGLRHGYELETRDALSEARPPSTATMGIDIDIDGNIKLVGGRPNMRLLDMGKRGLDKMIAGHRDEMTGRLDYDGLSLEKLRRAYVREIDSLDTKGVYKKARDSWGGPSASMDAVRFGKTVLSSKRTEEEVMDEVAHMSTNDKEFARIGLADDMRMRLGGAGLSTDESKLLVNTKNVRDRMRPLFKTREDYDSFIKDVFDEKAMFETKQHYGGSQSQERFAEEAYNTSQWSNLGHITHQMVTGHPFRAALTAWKTYRDLGLKPNPELNEKIAQILFSDDIKVTSRVGQKLSGVLSAQTPNPLGQASRNTARAAPFAGVLATEAVEPAPENPQGGMQVPRFAEGGVVTQPTVAMIGEQGPEVVVPLDDPAAAQQAADVAAARARRPYARASGQDRQWPERMAGAIAAPWEALSSRMQVPDPVVPSDPSDPFEMAAARTRAPYAQAQAEHAPSGLLDIGDYYGDKLMNVMMSPHDALTGALQVNDPETGMPTPEAMQRGQGVANMAMTGGIPLAQRGALGMAGGRMIQPGEALPKLRSAFDSVRAAQGNVGIAPISELIARSGLSKEEVHNALLDAARRGEVTLHQGNQAGESPMNLDAAIQLPGEPPFMYAFFKDKPKGAEPKSREEIRRELREGKQRVESGNDRSAGATGAGQTPSVGGREASNLMYPEKPGFHDALLQTGHEYKVVKGVDNRTYHSYTKGGGQFAGSGIPSQADAGDRISFQSAGAQRGEVSGKPQAARAPMTPEEKVEWKKRADAEMQAHLEKMSKTKEGRKAILDAAKGLGKAEEGGERVGFKSLGTKPVDPMKITATERTPGGRPMHTEPLGIGNEDRILEAGLRRATRVVGSRPEQEAMLRDAWEKRGPPLDFDDFWAMPMGDRIWNKEVAAWNKQHGTNIDPDTADLHPHNPFISYFDQKYLAGKKAPFPGIKEANEYFEESSDPSWTVRRGKSPGKVPAEREFKSLGTKPEVSGTMAGVKYDVTQAQYDKLIAARKAGAGTKEIQNMVDSFK